MTEIAKKTDPKLWDKVKTEVTESDKGGRPGQWSARKAQLASSEYKKEGGGYEGSQRGNHLRQWTDEKWGTKSGRKSEDTGERYLPERAREHLTDEEYRRTTAKKRADTRRGRQFSSQPSDIARKTAADRETGGKAGSGDGLASLPLAELRKRAAARRIGGRSRMRKAELVAALR